MRISLLEKIAEYLSRGHRRKIWKRLVMVLAAIVVFVTTYSLIIPAITLGLDSELLDNQFMFPVAEEQDNASYDIYDAGNLNIDSDASNINTDSNENSDVLPPEDNPDNNEPSPGNDLGEDNGYIEDESQSESESNTVEETVETESSTAYDSSESEETTKDASQSENESDTVEETVEIETSTAYDSSESEETTKDNSQSENESDTVEETVEVETSTAYDSSEVEESTEEESKADDNLETQKKDDLALQNTEVIKAVDLESLNGQTFALVNGKHNVAMLAEKLTDTNLAGMLVTVTVDNTGTRFASTSTENMDRVKAWSFESVEGSSKVYLTTGTGDAKQYVKITSDVVALTGNKEEASEITVVNGTGDYEGMIQLQGTDNNINLYGGDITRGFGPYADNGENEWFYAIPDIRVKGGASTVQGVTPNGSIIHMFDYWVTDKVSKNPQGDFGEGMLESGINDDHSLKFSAVENGYTGSCAPEKGLVKNKLVDGYPQLVSNDASLSYLFDPNEPVRIDSKDYKASYKNVKGLLQIDDEGYYYYDSKENFAEFDESSREFTLYDDWGVYAGGSSPNGQFFPFNEFNDVAAKKSNHKDINHYFGMTLTSRFIQENDGYTDITKSTPMTFEFAGDDDVWIYIDGVLVADLGGIHDASSAKINFATGEVIINEGTGHQETSKLYDIFEAAGQTDSVGWNSKYNPEGKPSIFDNNSYHTLKLFFLERGNMDSNLHLKYNLSTYPPTAISKVNQYGYPVEGAKFAVYAANENYDYLNDLEGNVVNVPEDSSFDEYGNILDSGGNIIVNALYTGTTDSEGEMEFVDADSMPYTIAEIEDLVGSNFIVREIEAPAGYRLIGSDINLFIAKHRVILCANTADSGVFSNSNLLVTAPNILRKHIGGGEITYYDPESANNVNGTLFPVIMKYVGPRDENGNAIAMGEQISWAPVYGNNDEGFTVVEVDDIANFIPEVINTAKQYDTYHDNEPCEFSLSPSGAMQTLLNGLPGDIQTYYNMLGANEKGRTEYSVAYYWTEASTLDGATPENTYRVDPDGEGYKFARTFGATVSVPNMINHMQIQKLNEDGNPTKDAKFAMYHVSEENNKIYYVSGSNLFYLEKDADVDNKGNATTSDGRSGKYSVNPDTGEITVKLDDGNTYKISPAVNARNDSLVKTTAENGLLNFYFTPKGKYFIREIDAPIGYAFNPTEIMTYVTDLTTYVNAGTVDDGVAVSRGPGYISSTMHQFASIGEIDNTLSWIYSQLRISDESTSFSDVSYGTYYTEWKYIKNDYANDFDADTTDNATDRLTTYLQYTATRQNDDINYTIFEESIMPEISNNSSGNKSKLSTNIGWSYLEIYQNYPYGTSIRKDYTGRYENWWKINGSDNPKTISSLFARTLRVEVKDPPTSHLEIRNTIEGAAITNNDTFNYDVILTDENGVALTDDYNYKVYNISQSGTREEIADSFITSGGHINLGNNQVAVIYNLPRGYKYKVTEEKKPKYITTASKDGNDFSFKDNELSVDGTLKWIKTGDSVDNTSLVHYVNRYDFSGEEIPSTGGRGVILFFITGIIMMLVTVCIYGIKRRLKKEGC